MNTVCFCGSKKPHSECHDYIHSNSFIAELYQLQKEMDAETAGQAQTCLFDESCCSRCLCVSEIEFVQILDYLAHNRTPKDMEALIQKSKTQWDILQQQDTELAHTLRGTASLYELTRLKNRKLPFPCLFWDKVNGCSIHPVRPLICRMPCSGSNAEKPCGERCLLYQDDYTIQKYKDKVFDLFLYPCRHQLIIRRPAPLFYYFQLIFPQGFLPITELEFAEKMMKLKRDEYIRWLVHTGKAKI